MNRAAFIKRMAFALVASGLMKWEQLSPEIQEETSAPNAITHVSLMTPDGTVVWNGPLDSAIPLTRGEAFDVNIKTGTFYIG